LYSSGSPRAAAEQGIDGIMNFFGDNSSTIIITFMIGTVSVPAQRACRGRGIIAH
jgi:hypothetical protein